ncbi:HAD family hydrolase [Parahaliea aestuarii]|uniref:Haloacid dehalogenase-like hydrolase n=1 Tax=Parahaliea aestuarii TaxID=1852021 RepID=A0A5C9A1U2_9GAMM|nr:HAD family hydrolase [Parahaliea aestuarii]TXS93321.1 haloacid dehalogenase-like hydrolase [Parahaliea aestuarii]
MGLKLRVNPGIAALLTAVLLASTVARAEDVLPSWREGPARDAIIAFVGAVTKEGADSYVPPVERVATFDNDGTLWSEQPVYFQLLFALDRIRALAPQHPEWKDTEPFKSAISGDMEGLKAGGMDGLMKIVAASHTGVTADEFAAAARTWLGASRHPQTGKPYTEMVYQPMLELLDYLRANEFSVFIVSGGGIDFLRVFAEEVYGVAPEQVVGSTLEAHFELRDGIPVIVRDAKVSLIDDKAGKPVGIYRHIGRRPIFAAGNSDGDLQMLQYTTIPRSSADTRPRFGLIVRHTDAEREYAYDRQSAIGKLDQALDEAPRRGWLVVDMKKDWRTVYPGA